MNWADLAVILIIVISVIFSARRGLVRSLLGVFSIIISLVIASTAYPIVADCMKDSKLETTIIENVEKSLKDDRAEENKEEAENEENSFIFLPKVMQESIEKGTEAIENAAIETTAKTISTLIINLVSMIAVFLIVRILMFVITHFLNFVTKLPVLKSVNKLLGGAVGVLVGLFIVYLILAIITFTALRENDAVIKEVKSSYIASDMYDNNFIVNLVAGE